MAKASDNVFPYIHLAPAVAPASPAAGSQRLYLDSADSNKPKLKDSSGVVTTIGGGGTTDTWHNVSSFTNSWVNYGGAEPVAAYIVDGAGNVHLRGTIKSGTVGTSAFTLPTGYRPSADVHFAVPTSTGTATWGEVAITPLGLVYIVAPAGNSIVRLDCCFSTI